MLAGITEVYCSVCILPSLQTLIAELLCALCTVRLFGNLDHPMAGGVLYVSVHNKQLNNSRWCMTHIHMYMHVLVLQCIHVHADFMSL